MSFDTTNREREDNYMMGRMVTKKTKEILKRSYVLLLICFMCLGCFSTGFFDESISNVSAASSDVTEERLFMKVPTYLRNNTWKGY